MMNDWARTGVAPNAINVIDVMIISALGLGTLRRDLAQSVSLGTTEGHIVAGQRTSESPLSTAVAAGSPPSPLVSRIRSDSQPYVSSVRVGLDGIYEGCFRSASDLSAGCGGSAVDDRNRRMGR
jgi:hypothetical protein